jgi:hypothetical protein
MRRVCGGIGMTTHRFRCAMVGAPIARHCGAAGCAMAVVAYRQLPLRSTARFAYGNASAYRQPRRDCAPPLLLGDWSSVKEEVMETRHVQGILEN